MKWRFRLLHFWLTVALLAWVPIAVWVSPAFTGWVEGYFSSVAGQLKNGVSGF
jgi:hypothetical protein